MPAPPLVPAVALGDLVEVVWAAFAAGVAVTGVYAGMVYGVARSIEDRHAGRTGRSRAFLVLAGVLGIVFLAALVFGLRIMAS